MKYKPSNSEIYQIRVSNSEDRLHYFLSRVIEAEEVWGMGDSNNWLLNEIDGRLLLPVWPYESLANECIHPDAETDGLDAMSLEQFIYRILPSMAQQNIAVEVLPSKTQAGKIVTAQELLNLLEGLMESGEYYLEG